MKGYITLKITKDGEEIEISMAEDDIKDGLLKAFMELTIRAVNLLNERLNAGNTN